MCCCSSSTCKDVSENVQREGREHVVLVELEQAWFAVVVEDQNCFDHSSLVSLSLPDRIDPPLASTRIVPSKLIEIRVSF
jgi:hypothetical protein